MDGKVIAACPEERLTRQKLSRSFPINAIRYCLKEANLSLNQTLSRTIITSLTTLMVVTILFFVGGEAIKYFAFALIIGVIVGTYSSMFIASPFLLYFKSKIKTEEE